MPKPDTERGLYSKFVVTRQDGSSARGKKHHGCQYFVLDVDHDKHAAAALMAYAKSCREEYPELEKDVIGLANYCRNKEHERVRQLHDRGG